jgi:predicted negative regulator of RcsB-dependent stress response
MVDPHFTEDEQAERLKQWWKQNGTSVITGAVLGLGIIFGVNYWRDYRESRAETASSLYTLMSTQYAAGNPEASRAAGRQLLQDYAGTPYAGKAALFLARVGYESGQNSEAREHLQWALDHGRDPATQHTARLRLARVLLAEGEFDAAAKLVSVSDRGAFASQYLELEGDLAMSRGDPNAAREAYSQALDNLPEGSGFAEFLNMKLDSAVAETAR